MKFSNSTTKAPVAELGGRRDEGLENPTPSKEQENTIMVSAAVQTRIALDEFTVIDIDPREENVEVTFSSRNEFGETRSTFGIALAPEEARKLASALLDGVAPQFGVAPIEEVEEHAAVARRFEQRECLSPAKAASRMRQERQQEVVPDLEIPVSELLSGTVDDVFEWCDESGVPTHLAVKAVQEYANGLKLADLGEIDLESSTVTDLLHEARRLGVSPGGVMRKLEESK